MRRTWQNPDDCGGDPAYESGTILARQRDVKRSLWILFLALVVLGALALFQPGSAGDVVASHETSPPPLAPVTVRHELVTVPAPAPTAPPTRTAHRADPPAAPAPTLGARPTTAGASAPAVQPASRDQSFFNRARRAVVGDGRYRPQPFPRVKGDNH
jgi:hypothetical protein